MTEQDADRLHVWIDEMPRQTLGLLWHWITLAYMQRCQDYTDSIRAVQPPAPPAARRGGGERDGG